MTGDDVQRLGAALADLLPGDEPGAARVAGAECDVLGDRHPFDEAEVLVDEGHLRGGCLGAERVARDGDLALVRSVDPGEDLDQGRLTGTVVTQ